MYDKLRASKMLRLQTEDSESDNVTSSQCMVKGKYFISLNLHFHICSVCVYVRISMYMMTNFPIVYTNIHVNTQMYIYLYR